MGRAARAHLWRGRDYVAGARAVAGLAKSKKVIWSPRAMLRSLPPCEGGGGHEHRLLGLPLSPTLPHKGGGSRPCLPHHFQPIAPVLTAPASGPARRRRRS